MEPAGIRGGGAVAQQILKRPKAASDMIEHSIQHHPDTGIMQRAADRCKGGVVPQPAVDLGVIPGIVAVGVALKHRREVDRIHTQLLQMRDPPGQAADPVHPYPVVLPRRPAKAQRVDLIKDALFIPCHPLPRFRGRLTVSAALFIFGSLSLIYAPPLSLHRSFPL